MGKAFELDLQVAYNRMRDRLRWVLNWHPQVVRDGNNHHLSWINSKSTISDVQLIDPSEASIFEAIDRAMEMTDAN